MSGLAPAVLVVALFSGSPPGFDLESWNEQRVALTHTGMWTLLAWAGANVASGGVGWAATDDRRWRAFHQMNLGWGAVNAAIATGALLTTDVETARALGPAASLDEQLSLERALLFNSGLDVGYLAVGAWLWERGLRKDDDRLVGFGQSILLQGGFLLAFDLAFFFVADAHGAALRRALTPGGVALSGRF